MDIKQLGKSAVLYTIGSISTRLVGFVLLPFYTNYLTKAEYGTAELIELMIAVSTILIGLGSIGGAMIRIYHDFDSPDDQNQVVSTTLISAMFLSIVISTLGWIFSPLLSRHFLGGDEYSILIGLAFTSIIMAVNQDICLIFMRIKDRALFFILYSVVSTFFLAGFNIYFIGFKQFGIWGFVYSKLIVFSMGVILLLTLVCREVGIRWNKEKFLRIVNFGSPLIMSSIAFFVIHFSDRFFLSRFSLDEVGVYSIGYKFGFLITFVIGEPFGRVWNARLFEFIKENDWREKFAKVFSYLFCALIIFYALLSFFSGDIIKIMVAQPFRNAAIVIPFIAMAYLLRECGDFFKQLLYIKKQTVVVSIVTVGCAFLNLFFNYYLIIELSFGLYGAMYSTLITWGVYFLVLYLISQRVYKLNYRLIPILTSFIFSTFLVWVASIVKVDNLFLSLVLHTCFTTVFILFIWVNGFFYTK